jgi:hypothetical protein
LANTLESQGLKTNRKAPETEAEFKSAMENLAVMLGLDSLYPKDSAILSKLAEKAAQNINPTLEALRLRKSSSLQLTKIAMFDTIIYCGNYPIAIV